MYNSFFRNLFQFGISRLFMSVDFMIALFLTKMGKQSNILFHYWYSCVVYLTSILYVGFCLAIKTENKFLILGVIFSTLYAIFVTYSLVKTTISLGIYKDIHDTRENGQ